MCPAPRNQYLNRENHMTDYTDIIKQHLYQAFPWTPSTPPTRFEAVSRAFIGTKQRRLGPVPSPETQVVIRDVLRKAEDAAALDGAGVPHVEVFVPWASVKQDPHRGLDALEVSALKQLACLSEEVHSYGWSVRFNFRLEDVSDLYLLGVSRGPEVEEYSRGFRELVKVVLPGSVVRSEGERVGYREFEKVADGYVNPFLRHLKSPSEDTAASLADIGWVGGLSEEQVNHYRRAYAGLGYYQEEIDRNVARFFAGTRARAHLGATLEPTGPFVKVAFTHPIPGNPGHHPRIYYRTLPERYGHTHVAPWIGRGYYVISSDGDVSPRAVKPGEKLTVHNNPIVWNGVRLQADYVLAD